MRLNYRFYVEAIEGYIDLVPSDLAYGLLKSAIKGERPEVLRTVLNGGYSTYRTGSRNVSSRITKFYSSPDKKIDKEIHERAAKHFSAQIVPLLEVDKKDELLGRLLRGIRQDESAEEKDVKIKKKLRVLGKKCIAEKEALGAFSNESLGEFLAETFIYAVHQENCVKKNEGSPGPNIPPATKLFFGLGRVGYLILYQMFTKYDSPNAQYFLLDDRHSVNLNGLGEEIRARIHVIDLTYPGDTLRERYDYYQESGLCEGHFAEGTEKLFPKLFDGTLSYGAHYSRAIAHMVFDYCLRTDSLKKELNRLNLSDNVYVHVISSIDGVFGSAGILPVSRELRRLLSDRCSVRLVVTTALKEILYKSDIEKARAYAYATAKEVSSILMENPKIIDEFRVFENAKEEKTTPIEEVAKSIVIGDFSEGALRGFSLCGVKILEDSEYEECYQSFEGQVHINTAWENERRNTLSSA